MTQITLSLNKTTFFNEITDISIKYKFQNEDEKFKFAKFVVKDEGASSGQEARAVSNESGAPFETNYFCKILVPAREQNSISNISNLYYQLEITSKNNKNSIYFKHKFNQILKIGANNNQELLVTLPKINENEILNFQKNLPIKKIDRKIENFGLWQAGCLAENEVNVSLKFMNDNGVIFNHDDVDSKNDFVVRVKSATNSATDSSESSEYPRNLSLFSSDDIIEDPVTKQISQNFKNHNGIKFSTPDSYCQIKFRTNLDQILSNTQLAILEICTPDLEVLGQVDINFDKNDLENKKCRKRFMLKNGERIVGDLNVDYCITKGLALPNIAEFPEANTDQLSFFLNQPKTILSGHRGSGSSFKSNLKRRSKYRENTIESFNKAHQNGAQAVEFDVQITKDNQIIVYHDLLLGIDNKMTSCRANNLEFLKEAAEKGNLQSEFELNSTSGPLNFNSKESWHLPTLKEMLLAVPESCAFNLEIKWPTNTIKKANQYEKTDELLIQNYVDMNFYVDEILKIVFENIPVGNKRKLAFSCFDANICEMLNLKQSRFPVLYLILGEFLTVPDDDYENGNRPRADQGEVTPADSVMSDLSLKSFEIPPNTNPFIRKPYNAYAEKRSLTFNRAISFAKFSDFSGINTDVINFLEHADEKISENLVQKFNKNGLMISVYGMFMMEKEWFLRGLRVGLDQMIVDDDGPYSYEGRE